MTDASLFLPLVILLVTLLALTILSITVPSRVIAVVFLIGSYLIGVLIALLFGFEFISMAILIVYMGAIAVFFLFIVMVLGGVAPSRSLTPYMMLGGVGVVIGSFIVGALFTLPSTSFLGTGAAAPSVISTVSSITPPLSSLGLVLYTSHAPLFVGAGFLLLVAIVVVITVVSLRGHSPRVSQESIDQRLRPYVISSRERGGAKNVKI